MNRILVVEDEAHIAMGLQDDLTMEGYAVEVVGDGEKALSRAREGAFDLILLDVMLPRKDGFAVCKELRRGGCKTPVILLTARAQEAEKVLGLELGADDYVTKPFSTLELQARIKALLRRVGDHGQAKAFQFGDVEVDLDRCEVHRNGMPVDVTPIEFKMLAAFLRSRGRVLSREQLLDAAWGIGTHVTDRVVDNHIVGLRRKIDDPAEPRFLFSVRGMGYRFDG